MLCNATSRLRALTAFVASTSNTASHSSDSKADLVLILLPQCQRFGHHTSGGNLMHPECQGLLWIEQLWLSFDGQCHLCIWDAFLNVFGSNEKTDK